MATQENDSLGPKYYDPSSSLVDYLNKELQFLKKGKESGNAEEIKEIESKGKGTVKKKNRSIRIGDERSKNLVSRKKTYYMDQIFQAFADIVYFLKFIDLHHADLGDLYEKDLQEFFGLIEPRDPSKDNLGEIYESPFQKFFSLIDSIDPSKRGSNQNPHCMFDEFIKASLSLRSLHPKNEVDFRIILINIMIRGITTALQFQMNDSEMMHHMFQDSSRFSMWPKLLEKGLEKDKERKNYPRRLYRYT